MWVRRGSAKIKDTESNKTNIAVHRRYLSENFQYQLRIGYLEYIARQSAERAKAFSEGGNASGVGNGGEMEENIPIDQTNGLPKFPPFGMESLGSRSFIRYRLIRLLRADLWHHLIENKLLLKFLVSVSFLQRWRWKLMGMFRAPGIHTGVHAADSETVSATYLGF